MIIQFLLYSPSWLARTIHSRFTTTDDTLAIAVLFAACCHRRTAEYASGASTLRTRRWPPSRRSRDDRWGI